MQRYNVNKTRNWIDICCLKNLLNRFDKLKKQYILKLLKQLDNLIENLSVNDATKT